jgi:biotin carboxyl carrier protein
MPKKTKGRKKPSKSNKSPEVPPSFNAIQPSSLVSTAAPGCYCWHGSRESKWLLGKPERFKRSDFGLGASDHVPDLSIDPEDNLLTVINATASPRVFHVTIEHPVVGYRGQVLEMGSSRDESGTETPCVAFALLMPPTTMLDVCTLELGDAPSESVKLTSDILDWEPHSSPNDMTSACVWDTFPLQGGPFLCSQGCGGGLTHFSHASTWHALDFACPVGTPVVAVGRGVVAEVRQGCTVGGCHVKHLFAWNSITLHLDANQTPAQPPDSTATHSTTHTESDSAEKGHPSSSSSNEGPGSTGVSEEVDGLPDFFAKGGYVPPGVDSLFGELGGLELGESGGDEWEDVPDEQEQKNSKQAADIALSPPPGLPLPPPPPPSSSSPPAPPPSSTGFKFGFQIDDPPPDELPPPPPGLNVIVVEYVHISAGSARVKVGDRVEAGQVLCLSGDVGFCPSPHLHIEAHTSAEPKAASIPMGWRDAHGVYFPTAGSSYPRSEP